jgi:hypothetical protein
MDRFRMLSLVMLLLGCQGSSRAGGQIMVEWTGNTAGRFAAPLRATWCPATGLIELLAVHGDTGVGSALFLRDSGVVTTGDYPVVLGATHPEPRPGAVSALRWFNNTSITAWEGLRGIIRLERGDSLLAGTLDLVLQGIEHPDTLHLTGRFEQVPLIRADTGCAATMRRNTL